MLFIMNCVLKLWWKADCVNAWIVLEACIKFEPLHFTFYSLLDVLSFLSPCFCLPPSRLSSPPSASEATKSPPPDSRVCSRACFHSNRLPWKLCDSAVHPILLSADERCFGKGKVCFVHFLFTENRDVTVGLNLTFKYLNPLRNS